MVHGWHAIVEHIDSSQIHLWLAFLDEITDPCLLREYRRLLSKEEVQQQQHFYFERDRHRYLVTRAMVRTVLSRYADVEPGEWRFTVNAYGKPSIDVAHAAARKIEFNVSHAGGLVVLAVAHERALGVDVENVRSQRAAVEIADRFFAPEELQALHALPKAEQPQRFFEYWTLKESYVKARGMGLSIALDRFAFLMEDRAQIRLTIDRRLGDNPERWAFWQFEPAPGYLLALCVARSDDVASSLRLARVVPLCADEPAVGTYRLRSW